MISFTVIRTVLPIPGHLIVPDCSCPGRGTHTRDSGTVPGIPGQLVTLNKSRRLSGLSGDAERNRRRFDGSSTDFDLGLHRLSAEADGGGFGDYRLRLHRGAFTVHTVYCGSVVRSYNHKSFHSIR